MILALTFRPSRSNSAATTAFSVSSIKCHPPAEAASTLKMMTSAPPFCTAIILRSGSLSEQDLERIFKQRLSPLYISVHSTDPALRSFMLGNRKAPDIMALMKRLAAGGIRMHTQIVTCPGVNDGKHLAKTIEDIAQLFPAVMSIAAVPVGVTAYRTGLYPVKVFTRSGARAVLNTIEIFRTRYRREFGTRLVFASDEFYIKAGVPFPSSFLL